MASIARNAAAARAAAPARIRGRILVLRGPNLNLSGTREPAAYGRGTPADIIARLAPQAKAGGVALAAFQSNHEGALIDRVHAAVAEGVGFTVIDPAGLTHSSVALRGRFRGSRSRSSRYIGRTCTRGSQSATNCIFPTRRSGRSPASGRRDTNCRSSTP